MEMSCGNVVLNGNCHDGFAAALSYDCDVFRNQWVVFAGRYSYQSHSECHGCIFFIIFLGPIRGIVVEDLYTLASYKSYKLEVTNSNYS